MWCSKYMLRFFCGNTNNGNFDKLRSLWHWRHETYKHKNLQSMILSTEFLSDTKTYRINLSCKSLIQSALSDIKSTTHTALDSLLECWSSTLFTLSVQNILVNTNIHEHVFCVSQKHPTVPWSWPCRKVQIDGSCRRQAWQQVCPEFYKQQIYTVLIVKVVHHSDGSKRKRSVAP